MRSELLCAGSLYLLLSPLSFALQFPYFTRPAMSLQSTKFDPLDYPQAPSSLNLEQVHVYVRHGKLPRGSIIGKTCSMAQGERTPVGVRMNGPPANIPEYWLLCQAGRKFSAAVWDSLPSAHGVYTPASVQVERVVEFRNSSSRPGVWWARSLRNPS